MPQSAILNLVKNFEEFITNGTSTKNNIEYKVDLKEFISKDIGKATIKMSANAYMKMYTLVEQCPTEIAWHGMVSRAGNIFEISDIIMYPQFVSGGAVETDEMEYTNWMMDPDLDINQVRLQGHSHVNMGVSPSPTDTTYMERMLSVLPDDDYYIFMIVNKHKAMSIWIYDFSQNVIFEREDINFYIHLPDGTNIMNWYTDVTKENVRAIGAHPFSGVGVTAQTVETPGLTAAQYRKLPELKKADYDWCKGCQHWQKRFIGKRCPACVSKTQQNTITVVENTGPTQISGEELKNLTSIERLTFNWCAKNTTHCDADRTKECPHCTFTRTPKKGVQKLYYQAYTDLPVDEKSYFKYCDQTYKWCSAQDQADCHQCEELQTRNSWKGGSN